MAKLQLNDVLLNISILHLPFIITGVFVVYFFIHAFYQIYFSPLSKIPAPWYAVISDLWLKFHTLAGRRVFVVHELHKKYGPFVRISPTETDISDIDSVKQIHSPQDPYRKSDWYGPLTGSINGVYALLPNDAHRARRRAWGNAWSNTNISMMEPAVRKYVYICAEKINRELEAGRKPDLMHWFQFLTTDVIAEISYGKDMGMLENETVSSFVEDLLAILVIGAIRAQFPFIGMIQKIMSYIPHPKIQWFVNADKRISDYSDQAILDYRREVQSARDKKGNLRPSLLAALLDDLDNPNVKHKMTMEEIRWEATDNLIGGSDTVTITATYLIWAIYRHPNVRAKLETELTNAINGQEITDERIQHLPYLKVVIKEVLRLYSAGQFGLPRAVPDGGRFIGGYYFPAGTNVTSQGYTVHRNPEVFDDPYAFKPERWLNPTKEMENSFMPWGGHSRNCLGQNLAIMELRLIAAVMLTVCPSATLAESCTDDSMELENYFVLRPKGHKCELVSSR